mmetsp:Transcript_43342/g.97545  ORF Transcript_43342/g.97545 Transcript_43342/m.97545 type:complete len:106 (+) Transcript_43342:375-692(+)
MWPWWAPMSPPLRSKPWRPSSVTSRRGWQSVSWLCAKKRNEIQKTRRDKSVQSYQRMVTAHDDTASELVDRIAALDREIAVIGARNAVKARRIEELKPHSDYKPE